MNERPRFCHLCGGSRQAPASCGRPTCEDHRDKKTGICASWRKPEEAERGNQHKREIAPKSLSSFESRTNEKPYKFCFPNSTCQTATGAGKRPVSFRTRKLSLLTICVYYLGGKSYCCLALFYQFQNQELHLFSSIPIPFLSLPKCGLYLFLFQSATALCHAMSLY